MIVTGSRSWHDHGQIIYRLAQLPKHTVIVHGNARGADRIAADEARKLGLLIESHPANWDRYGNAAGYLRNREMAAFGADLCLAFWDGRSRGTESMIGLAREAGIPVEVIRKP